MNPEDSGFSSWGISGLLYSFKMEESITTPPEPDPWGFASSTQNPRRSSEDKPEDDPWGAFAPSRGDSASGNKSATDTSGQRLSASEGSDHGQHLRIRALSLAIALSTVFAIGCIAEIVAASRFIQLAGLKGLVIIYPLAGIGLILVTLTQVTWIDRIDRQKAFVRVALGYGVVFIIALVLIANSSSRLSLIGTGLAVVLSEQVNFLLPLIIWAMLGDLFNAAESRKVFPWVLTWRYAGQTVGLVIASLAPLVLTRLDVPLYTLLLVCPIGLIGLAIFLPRALKGRALNHSHGEQEDLRESIKTAWNFVGGVKAFRGIFITSTLVMVAATALAGTLLSQSADWADGDEGKLQILYGSTLLVVFVICWILQRGAVTKTMEKLNIPGSLALLPIAALIGGVVIVVGVQLGLLWVMLIGIVAWRIPWWSIDDVARRAAMTLVPDQRRARVSFIVDLVPYGVGLIISGGILGIANAFNAPILAPILAIPFAVAAVLASRIAIKSWADALINPHLKRRRRLSEK